MSNHDPELIQAVARAIAESEKRNEESDAFYVANGDAVRVIPKGKQALAALDAAVAHGWGPGLTEAERGALQFSAKRLRWDILDAEKTGAYQDKLNDYRRMEDTLRALLARGGNDGT